MFRRINRAEAAKISLWPDRIDGTSPWKKKRSVASVESEYDARYAEMRALWGPHKDSLRHLVPAIWPLSFVHKLNVQNWARMQSFPQVYGKVDLDRYLVSFQDELYEGSIVVMEAMFRQLVVQTVQRVVDHTSIGALVELGCGAGFNLINVTLHCAVKATGCELSPSAVALINEIAADTGLPIAAQQRDYMKGDLSDLAGADKWAIFTVHAIEQTPRVDVAWIRQLLEGRHPPLAGIHLEPLHSPDGSFASDCRRYAEINDYNGEFYAVARNAEAEGLIDIVHYSPRVLGSQAHNPTSVLVWQSKHYTAQGLRAW